MEKDRAYRPSAGKRTRNLLEIRPWTDQRSNNLGRCFMGVLRNNIGIHHQHENGIFLPAEYRKGDTIQYRTNNEKRQRFYLFDLVCLPKYTDRSRKAPEMQLSLLFFSSLHSLPVINLFNIGYVDLTHVTSDWSWKGTTHQVGPTVGVIPAVKLKDRRRGLMNRLITSLPCQDTTCFSDLNKKLHRYPASSRHQHRGAQTTKQLEHRCLSACLSFDIGIWLWLLNQCGEVYYLFLV